MDSIFKLTDVQNIANKRLRHFFEHNLIFHCHHYNSRLQKTIEENKNINGKKIIKESTLKVFNSLLQNTFKKYHSDDKNHLICDLYRFLGFGNVNLDQIDQGIVTSDSSHFVEGWQCGSLSRSGQVCTFTEGFLIAATKFLTGQDYEVVETRCMNDGHKKCHFKITPASHKIDFCYNKKIISLKDCNHSEDSDSRHNKFGPNFKYLERYQLYFSIR